MTQIQREKLKLREKFKLHNRRLEEEYNHLKSYLVLSIGTAFVIGIAIGKITI